MNDCNCIKFCNVCITSGDINMFIVKKITIFCD